MSHYAITAVRWGDKRREVAKVRLHRVVRQTNEPRFELDVGAVAAYQDVAALIIGNGDNVWVMTADGRGTYRRSDAVGVTPGKHLYLFSHAKDGSQTTALDDLPTF
jgi:hypothetical protein